MQSFGSVSLYHILPSKKIVSTKDHRIETPYLWTFLEHIKYLTFTQALKRQIIEENGFILSLLYDFVVNGLK